MGSVQWMLVREQMKSFDLDFVRAKRGGFADAAEKMDYVVWWTPLSSLAKRVNE